MQNIIIKREVFLLWKTKITTIATAIITKITTEITIKRITKKIQITNFITSKKLEKFISSFLLFHTRCCPATLDVDF